MKISIGIPTYNPSPTIIKTVQSVLSQSAFSSVCEIIIIVDGGTMPELLKRELKHKKIKIVTTTKRMGQSKRINDLCAKFSGNYLLLLNDDVLLDPNALRFAIEKLRTQPVDLLAGRVKPLKAESELEKILYIPYLVNQRIIASIKNHDHYLACNGRCIVLSKRLAKSLSIPVHIHNNDAYIYFFTKENKFKFYYLSKFLCYYRSPAKLSEHFNQSRKFHVSQEENQKYFKEQLAKHYYVPFYKKLLFTLRVEEKHPDTMFLYLFVYLLSWLRKYDKISTIGYWNTDISTKNL